METNFIPQYSLFLNTDNHEKYKENKESQNYMVIKCGQRKLFFNTIYFVNSLKKPGLIVYAGAASGKNLIFIIKQYPQHTYMLFDINPFNKTLFNLTKNNKKIIIRNELLTNDICNELLKTYKTIYLISDIRTGERKDHDKINIPEDMEMQKKWYYLLHAKAAMLKFRLPWQSGKTSYLEGKIMLQPRIGSTSSETRLLVGKKANEIEYDNDIYNDSIYYYHKYNRAAYHEISKDFMVPGMCHCNDCWMEVEILKICNLKAKIITNMVNKFLGNTNVKPHNLFINERNINERIKKCGDLTIYKSSVVINYITPSTSQKVYVLNNGLEVVKPIDFTIENEYQISSFKKYKVNINDEELLKLLA